MSFLEDIAKSLVLNNLVFESGIGLLGWQQHP
jgi:hypothetical protein